MRGRAYRRHHRFRMVKKAKRIFKTFYGDHKKADRAQWWADNLKARSYYCSDDTPNLQQRRAPSVSEWAAIIEGKKEAS